MPSSSHSENMLWNLSIYPASPMHRYSSDPTHAHADSPPHDASNEYLTVHNSTY